MSVFSGGWKAPSYPWVMGHEAFGTIDAVGLGVDPRRIGQTVVVEPNIACLTCAPCRRGLTSACVARQSVGMNRPGALAERLVIPARFAWPIGGVAPVDLVCMEPFAVVTAALRRLGTPAPASALVVGVGAQGLLMSLALVDRSVEVHVHDVNPVRVAFATRLGAMAATPDQAERRFELVVDTVGSPGSFEAALGSLDAGGTLLLLGLDNRPLDVTAQKLVRGQAVVRGSLTYDHPGDFEAAIRKVTDTRLRPGRVVSDEYPLDAAQAAFDRGPSAAGKSWIRIAQMS